ncbi:hypothetical protein LZ32DRAFT_608670 [Colletotrichum eremochloae]|nr:hypothetical protein LZ32DRAFT_608670 [Colletotrichum eremochloae]
MSSASAACLDILDPARPGAEREQLVVSHPPGVHKNPHTLAYHHYDRHHYNHFITT